LNSLSQPGRDRRAVTSLTRTRSRPGGGSGDRDARPVRAGVGVKVSDSESVIHCPKFKSSCLSVAEAAVTVETIMIWTRPRPLTAAGPGIMITVTAGPPALLGRTE
jgi:hypothetical protein